MLASLYGSAQQLPPYERSRQNQVLSDRAAQAKFFFALPNADVFHMPAYVPDSIKAKGLWIKTGAARGLYIYNPLTGLIEKVGNDKAYIDSIAALKANDISVEHLSNKSDNSALGTSTTLYPTQRAVKTYADGLVVGLLSDRGSYNASGDVYPTTGGSGASGSILKGNLWAINGAGTLSGVAVGIGDWLRALSDNPGQTSGNWAIVKGNFGYVPENTANKINTITVSASANQFPTAAAVRNWAIVDANQVVYVQNARISVVQEIRTQGLLRGNTILASGTGSAINVEDRSNGFQYTMYGDDGFHFGVSNSGTYNDFWTANYATQVVTFPQSPVMPGANLTGNLNGTTANFTGVVGGAQFLTSAYGNAAPGDIVAAMLKVASLNADRRLGVVALRNGVEGWFMGTDATDSNWNLTIDGTIPFSINRSTKAAIFSGNVTGSVIKAGGSAGNFALEDRTNGAHQWTTASVGDVLNFGASGVGNVYLVDFNTQVMTIVKNLRANSGITVTGIATVSGDIVGARLLSDTFGGATAGGITITTNTGDAAAGMTFKTANVTRMSILGSGQINTAFDFEITDPTKGLILKSPNSARWRITINNSGALISTAL